MLGILAAAAGAALGGLVGAGATVVGSLIHGDGLPAWHDVLAGATKGAILGGVGVGAVFFAAAVLGVALPTIGLGLGAGVLASALYSVIFKHRKPTLESLGAGAVGGLLAGGALALALGAASFLGAGAVASAVAAPVAVVAGSVAGGELTKEETRYRDAMEEEKKHAAPDEIVVPGDITRQPDAPSRTPGMTKALSR